MVTITLANKEDMTGIMKVIEEARIKLRNNGTLQWNTPEGYPNEIDFNEDIDNGNLYVAKANDIVIGVCAIVEGVEEEYNHLEEGKWLNKNKPYLSIHRIAVAKDYYGKGISSLLVQKALEIAKNRSLASVKGDTHPKNIAMQKLLLKNGFVMCGKIHLLQTSIDNERVVFEKLVK